MGLTRLAVYRPLTVLMGLLGLVLLGGIAYTYLKVDRLPPVNTPFVSVSLSYPQASAQDVEQLVVIPVENAVSGMEGVSSLNSNASEGSGSVNIQLADGVDPKVAALEVERRVAAIRNRLPAEADGRVNRADPNARAILNIALTGAPLGQLLEITTDQIQPRLQSVLGVASVNISGGLQREIQVKVDYAQLAAYGLSITQVSNALTAANVTAPAGSLQLGTQLLNVRSLGRFQNIGELQDLVLAQVPGAGPVLLRDIATVQQGYKQQAQIQRLNGQEAVGFSIVKQSDANALQVADDVRAEIRRLTPLLPEGAVVHIANDTSVFTRASLDAIQHDLLFAVLLVGAVMLVFLHVWRHTLIILLAIPTSLVSTFAVMYVLGFTLNVMSLMALALMIGILVDDSIVVLENIHRHLQLGENPWQAALNGRAEIGLAAMAITFADVVVYIPVAFMSGIVGSLFRQYGLTIVAATLLSLLVSFTLTPLLASRWLRHEAVGTGLMARFGTWWDDHFEKFAVRASSLVPLAVRWRWVVVVVGVALVAGSVSLLPLNVIGSEFAPTEDDNNFNVNVSMPPGTSLERMDQVARQAEDAVRRIPEVQDVFTTVSAGGGGGGFGGGGGGRASMAVQVVPKQQRARSVFDIVAEVRQLSRTLPGANVSGSVESPLGFGGGGGGTTAVNLQVRGPDLDTLNQVVAEIQAVTADVPGLVDLQNTSQRGTPELRVVLDRSRMAQLGVTSQQVASALRATLGGAVVSQLRPTGSAQQDITLIASDGDRSDLAKLASIPVAGGGNTAGAGATGAGTAASATAGSTIVTLGQIATLAYGTGPVQIQRVDRNRAISLNGIAAGRPLGEVASDVREAVNRVPLPPGYTVTMRGQVEQFNRAFGQLGQALALSLVMEYMLLVALFGSWLYPLVLILAVPLAVVGSFGGLWLTHNTLNIFSIIGLIMAEGLVAKNGILLVDYTNTLRQRGMARLPALTEAARVRLRPILMTTATMCFGMLPLALKLEPGAESRAPMAVVVIGGVLSSTLLALLAVPALYTLLDDLQERVFRRKGDAAAGAPPTAPLPALEPVHTNGHQNGHAAPAPAAGTGSRRPTSA